MGDKSNFYEKQFRVNLLIASGFEINRCSKIMCLGIFGAFLGISPYIWLFSLPILGSFCGVEAVQRLSLMLSFQTVLTSLLPDCLVSVILFYRSVAERASLSVKL